MKQRAPQTHERRATHVYLIQRADGAIKIGISRHPKRRRSQLQLATPDRLTLIYWAKIEDPRGALCIEQQAHKVLADHRLSGEWFNCEKMDAIAAIDGAIAGVPEIKTHYANEWDRFFLRMEIEQSTLPASVPCPKRWSSRDAQSVLFDNEGNRLRAEKADRQRK